MSGVSRKGDCCQFDPVEQLLYLNGLSAGIRHWFRVARIDKDGQHPFSETIRLIVV